MSTQAAKIAVAENRLDDHEDDIDDLEKRVRAIELERQLLRLARRELARMRRELPKLVEDSAVAAVELVLERRDLKRQSRFGGRLQFITTACTAAMAVAAFAALFLR